MCTKAHLVNSADTHQKADQEWRTHKHHAHHLGALARIGLFHQKCERRSEIAADTPLHQGRLHGTAADAHTDHRTSGEVVAEAPVDRNGALGSAADTHLDCDRGPRFPAHTHTDRDVDSMAAVPAESEQD